MATKGVLAGLPVGLRYNICKMMSELKRRFLKASHNRITLKERFKCWWNLYLKRNSEIIRILIPVSPTCIADKNKEIFSWND